MILEDFQKQVFERNIYNPTSKEKFKGYYYNVIDLTSEVTNLYDVVFSFSTNYDLTLKSLGKVLASSFLLLKELNFPINSEEFSLDSYKNEIKLKPVNLTTSIPLNMIITVGRLNELIRNSIKDNKQELNVKTKIDMINQIYFIITSTFELINSGGYNIDIILEKHIESLPVIEKGK